MRIVLLNVIILVLSCSCQSRQTTATEQPAEPMPKQEITTGASQTNEYLDLLKDKSVGMVVNHTSTIGSTHMVDSLLACNIQIKRIFAPEHGFRGDAGAGEKINNSVDSKTGLPIISLYGNNRKPSMEDLKGIDWMVFDIQDVGARFYTYISTMHYVMEACAENNIKMLILDRPNPNGYYVDGPVLDKSVQSFVGMHPIPIVHGLTVGELAQMINGEKWLPNGAQCDLRIIKVKNYSHHDMYSLPVKPSPNLPNNVAVNLYSSLCLFEPTNVSIGRGTEFPFQVAAYPDKRFLANTAQDSISFIPESIPNAAPTPKHEGVKCFGIDFRKAEPLKAFTLSYLLTFYKKAKEIGKADDFFSSESFFNKLAGTPELLQQIKAGKTEEEIRSSWQEKLNAYKKMRKQYLLYEDFE